MIVTLQNETVAFMCSACVKYFREPSQMNRWKRCRGFNDRVRNDTYFGHFKRYESHDPRSNEHFLF